MMYYHQPYFYDSGFGFFAFLFPILFWVLIIWLVGSVLMALFKHFNDREEWGKENNDKYLDIIKQRYAKGEITKKEYDELRRDFE
ncbi:SHOCT domain-containing protein [Candidatus Microgenomates bacterium]|nr:SHOCT domain-containing protein [Candidatus Microgenomates bacterium]